MLLLLLRTASDIIPTAQAAGGASPNGRLAGWVGVSLRAHVR